MEEVSKQIFIRSFIVTLLCINIIPDPTVANENEFSYDRTARNGPEHWGDVRKEWETCKIGRMQSPVAIQDKNVVFAPQSEELLWTYIPKDAVMKNLGHNIVIEWEDDVGAVWINGTEFKLKQMHWHIPSENTINGHRFHMEVHLFHEHGYDKKMAMVSILYKFGRPEPFFTKIEKFLGPVSGKIDATVKLGTIDPTEIKRDINKYYRLKGSITTPPCTEGVTWTINREVRTISREQLELLKHAAIPEYRMNARPVQNLNSRVVQLFG